MVYGTPITSPNGGVYSHGRVRADPMNDLLYRSTMIDSIVFTDDDFTPAQFISTREKRADKRILDIGDETDKKDREFMRWIVPIRGRVKEMLRWDAKTHNYYNMYEKLRSGEVAYGLKNEEKKIVASTKFIRKKKRMRLSIEGDDEDEDANMGPSLRSRSDITRARFVPRIKRGSVSAIEASKPEKSSDFVRETSNLLVYPKVSFSHGSDLQFASSGATDPKVKMEDGIKRENSTKKLQTNRQANRFMNILGAELGKRFHRSGEAPESTSSQIETRTVKPYTFEPLLLKRFNVKGVSEGANKEDTWVVKKTIRETGTPDHIDLYWNDSFNIRRKPDSLFQHIFSS